MDIASLYPLINREVPNCPQPSMRDALLRAAREFCNETWLIRRTFTFTTIAGQQQYDVVVPDNEQAFAIRHAAIANTTAPINSWPLQIVYPTTINPNIGEGQPTGICLVPYTKVAMSQPPDQAYNVTVETLTEPAPQGNTIPDELGVRYDRALAYGALEWLMRQKGNPWYDPQMSEYYHQRFNQEIVKGRGEAAFDFSPGQREWLRAPFIQRRSYYWGY